MFMPAAPHREAPPTRLRASAHAARGHKWNLQFLRRARQQDHVRHVVFAGMSAAFEAIDADGVRSRSARPSASDGTDVHLWMTLIPAAFNAGMYCSGLRPAVFDDLDSAFPDRGNIFRIGRRAEGRQECQVSRPRRLVGHVSRHRAISLASNSGVRCVNPVMTPRPARVRYRGPRVRRSRHKCIPPWMIGCSMPKHFSDGCFHMKFPFLFSKSRPGPNDRQKQLLEMFPSPLQASDFFGLDRDTYPQSKKSALPRR